MLEKFNYEEIYKAFKLYDQNDSNGIRITDLKKVADELAENISTQELEVGWVFVLNLIASIILKLFVFIYEGNVYWGWPKWWRNCWSERILESDDEIAI